MEELERFITVEESNPKIHTEATKNYNFMDFEFYNDNFKY